MASITLVGPGPLYLSLKHDNVENVVRVSSWDRTPHGGPGPIEAQGTVEIGDALVKINGESLRGIGFKACIAAIRQVSSPRTISFHRPEPQRGKQRASSDLHCQHRPIVWRIMLRYLPLEQRNWLNHTRSQRDLYKQFLKEFMFDCRDISPGLNSWTQLQLDSNLKNDIHKDVVRTYLGNQIPDTRNNALKRILFVYAKLNPGVRYVQGMDEIAGTLLCVFSSDLDENWAPHAESDSFFCFSNLMSEIRDLFIHTLDTSETGVGSKLSKVNKIIQTHDIELWLHLDSGQLDPAHYSIRWMTTLLAREFPLSDTVCLWDSILAQKRKVDFLCYLCASMLLTKRSLLLEGDFTNCLSLLQRYPPSNTSEILQRAVSLRYLDESEQEQALTNASWLPLG